MLTSYFVICEYVLIVGKERKNFHINSTLGLLSCQLAQSPKIGMKKNYFLSTTKV
jgi:hypothetical protein